MLTQVFFRIFKYKIKVMITAKQFLKKHAPCSTEGFMIEFAKLHVEAALKAASEKAKLIKKENRVHYQGEWWSEFENVLDTKSILKAYPKSNIK